jgi:hypothetical protein
MTMPNPPPVPQGLREMLKDYPEHVQRVQEVLNSVVEKPSKGTPPFEVAIWVLESRLDAFISEAREELEVARAAEDADTIVRAKEKLRLMLDCRSQTSWGDDNLADYFGIPRMGYGHAK